MNLFSLNPNMNMTQEADEFTVSSASEMNELGLYVVDRTFTKSPSMLNGGVGMTILANNRQLNWVNIFTTNDPSMMVPGWTVDRDYFPRSGETIRIMLIASHQGPNLIFRLPAGHGLVAGTVLRFNLFFSQTMTSTNITNRMPDGTFSNVFARAETIQMFSADVGTLTTPLLEIRSLEPQDVLVRSLVEHEWYFDLAGGRGTPQGAVSFMTGERLSISDPVRNGFAFSGWAEVYGDEEIPIDLEGYRVLGPKRVIALWEPLSTCMRILPMYVKTPESAPTYEYDCAEPRRYARRRYIGSENEAD